MAALRGGCPFWAAVLLALAVDAKPWAVGFVLLLFLVRRGRRLTAFATWSAVVGIAWLPFVIADPGSVVAAGFRIDNAAGSALRAIGVSDAMTPVGADRLRSGSACLSPGGVGDATDRW